MRVAIGRALLVALLALAGSTVRQDGFPHQRHEGLFPLCEGCHAGIPSGAGDLYPAPVVCARCHDGDRVRRVDWEGPPAHASNLAFSHPDHRAVLEREGDSASCVTCHGTGEPGRMAVSAATADACLGCHAHEAPAHLAEGRDCLSCHVRLTEAPALDAERIATFDRPATHERSDFDTRHAPADADAASCAVCHARESCERCHVNAGAVPAIAALESDARVAALVRGRAPVYPVPLDHRERDWDGLHGAAALADAEGCANCHTRDGCASCHTGPLPAALPERPDGDLRGVRIAAPFTVHPVGYAERHGTDAATGTATCTSCHDRARCESCHTAGTTPSFHEPDYAARHGPAAYAADTECVSCHSTEVFCRSCHSETGLAARDRVGVAFHTSNAFWLVGHGASARQGLAACASCHGQDSCMRCHSARGSWRVSPHGPGFDPARARDANPATCRLCHPAGTVR